ncbi:MAG: hypothetical protein P1U34_02725 [Coxiellaceae bacterium]|nr:hypothetical protein [Coxiellaceae bacterium]
MAKFLKSDLITLCRTLILSPPNLTIKQTDRTRDGMELDEAVAVAIGQLFNHADVISKCNIFEIRGDKDFLRMVAGRKPLMPREGFATLEKPNLLEQWFSILSMCLSVCDALSAVRRYRLERKLSVKDIDKSHQTLLELFTKHSDLEMRCDVESKGLRSTIRALRYQAAALRVGDLGAEMYIFDKLRGCQEGFFIGDSKIDYRLVEAMYLSSSALKVEDVSVLMPPVPMPTIFSASSRRRGDFARAAPAEFKYDDRYQARNGRRD